MTTQQRSTVLVVDDESKIRRLVASSLEDYGFDVMCAADGEHALEIFKSAPERADLVVLDRNPLAVDPREIRDIQVLATIKEGDTLYERDAK